MRCEGVSLDWTGGIDMTALLLDRQSRTVTHHDNIRQTVQDCHSSRPHRPGGDRQELSELSHYCHNNLEI